MYNERESFIWSFAGKANPRDDMENLTFNRDAYFMTGFQLGRNTTEWLRFSKVKYHCVYTKVK